jgi:hypothetical protein
VGDPGEGTSKSTKGSPAGVIPQGPDIASEEELSELMLWCSQVLSFEDKVELEPPEKEQAEDLVDLDGEGSAVQVNSPGMPLAAPAFAAFKRWVEKKPKEVMLGRTVGLERLIRWKKATFESYGQVLQLDPGAAVRARADQGLPGSSKFVFRSSEAAAQMKMLEGLEDSAKEGLRVANHLLFTTAAARSAAKEGTEIPQVVPKGLEFMARILAGIFSRQAVYAIRERRAKLLGVCRIAEYETVKALQDLPLKGPLLFGGEFESLVRGAAERIRNNKETLEMAKGAPTKKQKNAGGGAKATAFTSQDQRRKTPAQGQRWASPLQAVTNQQSQQGYGRGRGSSRGRGRGTAAGRGASRGKVTGDTPRVGPQ